MFSFFTGSTQGNIHLSKSHPEQLRVGGEKTAGFSENLCQKMCTME